MNMEEIGPRRSSESERHQTAGPYSGQAVSGPYFGTTVATKDLLYSVLYGGS